MNSGIASLVCPDGRILKVTIQFASFRNRYRLDWRSDDPVLFVPRGTSMPEVQTILIRHRRWFARRMSERERIRKISPASSSKREFPFGGQYFRSEIGDDPIRTITVDHDNRTLLIPRDMGLPDVNEAIRLWILEHLSLRIIASLELWSSKTGLRPDRINIRPTRSQWGSMSNRGGLSLSWFLFLYPPRTIDYIVLHELVHLIHRNHSRAFWKAVETHFPEYRDARNELKTHIAYPSWLATLPGGHSQIRVRWERDERRFEADRPVVEDPERNVLL
jgi:predicted metal-dependent hydrolase